MKNIQDAPIKNGSRVFVRMDLDVPIFDGKIGEAYRIDAGLDTLRFIIKNGGKPIEEELKPFVKDYIKFWVNGPGRGQNNHYKFINETMKMIFIDSVDDIEEDKKDEVFENEITKPIIEEYITNVLVNFTKFKEDGTPDLRYYIDNIFINIVDIWGFIESYNPILSIFSQNYNKLTPEMNKVFKQLQYIYHEYLYSLKTYICSLYSR